MKILCISDTVVDKLLDRVGGGPAVDGVGLAISCGDLPPEYLAAVRNRYDAPLFYVLGNHDLRYGQSPPTGCRNIHRRLITVEGLNVVGFSGSRWYNGNVNQYKEQQMTAFIRGLRFQLWRTKRLDLVVTHAPPRFVHDAEDPCHQGFSAYRAFIEKYRPRFFLHGHIHADFTGEEERTTMIDTTSVINCYGYHVFEI